MMMGSPGRMSVDIFEIAEKKRRKITMSTVLTLACAVLALPLAAQQRGPLPPPPGTVVPSGAPADSEKAHASRQEMSSHITNEPPALPIEQIIQKFTQHEDEFRKERDNFTYTQ